MLRSALLGALALVPALAEAQTPTTLPAYQWTATGQYSSAGFIPSGVMMWFDTTYTGLTPQGGPRPTSTQYPLPIQCISGCSGGGGGGGGTLGTVASPNVAGGNASSAAPSYAAGANPLSLDLAGNLRVTLPSGTSVAVSSLPSLPTGTNSIGTVNVGNLPATQPVSLASVPLPSGAATSAGQGTINADGGVQVHVVNQPATQPVSAVSLPLPAGAATSANQATINADGGSQVHIQNFPATQPVSGTVAVSNLPATQAVSASALPLPAGAATAANQPALNADGGSLAHVTNFPASQPVTDAATEASAATIATNTGRAWRGPGTPTQTSVSVAAGTSTQLIAANDMRRALIIGPELGTTSLPCAINQAGGTASATSLAIPGGWSWTETDPPPATAVTAYCTSATTISVTETD